MLISYKGGISEKIVGTCIEKYYPQKERGALAVAKLRDVLGKVYLFTTLFTHRLSLKSLLKRAVKVLSQN